MTNNNTTYKNTAIGLIPSDWEVERFDNVFELFSTNSFSRDNLVYEKTQNEIQNIHYGDIHSKFKFEILDCEAEQLPYIKDELILNQKFNYLKDGDLIITDASEDYDGVGQSVEVKNIGTTKVVSGLHTFLARDNSNKTVQGFRTYTFKNPKVAIELKKIATGISVYSISKSELQKIKIPLPPLPEQQKIASILSTWDKAIDNCKVIIEELKIRNKGLTQKLFNKDFEKKHLSEIFERITTKNIENNQNVITISAKRGFIKQTDFFNKVIASTVLDNYTLVKKGDFCYNKSYSNGYDWGATKRLNDFEKAVVTTLYICFRLKDENQNSGDFFEYFFESGILNKGLSKVANEGGRAHGLLNVTSFDFFNIKIGVPTFEEQKAIAAILDKATQELKQYEQKLETLQWQKKGLMQQLLTGKTRVKI